MARMEGTVKFFDPKKNFGFIKVGNGGDVFLGGQALRASGMDAVQEGDRLQFDTVEVKGRQPRAENIKRVDGQ